MRQLGGTWLRRAREAAARGQRSFAPSAGQLPPEIASISDEDAGAVAALAMTAAVDQAEQELRSLAQRVDAGREKQAGLRESIAELRSIIQSRKFPVAFEYGDPATTVELRDARQAKALLEQLETELQGATDISQQLQLQLQDAMNKQQQAVQILSNLMKQQHDTLKAIIQNMR